jgi:hypothetical protein
VVSKGVEQRRVALGQDFKNSAVFEIGPSGPIGEGVGVHRGGKVQLFLQALRQVAVPRSLLIRFGSSGSPKPKLQPIGAAVIATDRK